GGGEVVAQAEQPVLGRHELLLQLGEPGGVREVPRADHRDALELRPAREVLEVEVAAGGARVLRVDVQVGDEGHGWVRGVLWFVALIELGGWRRAPRACARWAPALARLGAGLRAGHRAP